MSTGFSFRIQSPWEPAGSQPQAIESLVAGLHQGLHRQTLLGVTGSGKTFTMARVIAAWQRPALVLVHNKTLATQLYQEFRQFFPENRVEYFVSYFDYYQPESYLPQKDQYIEKDSQINEQLEQMRLSTTASLLARPDTLVVASVSAIYSSGNPANYRGLGFELREGAVLPRQTLLQKLVEAQYERNDLELRPGRFRVKGEVVDIIPGYQNRIIRLECFGDEIERIVELDKTGSVPVARHAYFHLYPARHFLSVPDTMEASCRAIEAELEARLPELPDMERYRLRSRTLFDLEMMRETGSCKGIENYSRYLDGRQPGERPFCLLDYFPDDFLLIIDESHQTLPQIRAMHAGDRSRKETLVDYGFRLPSAFDNRPLTFEEFEGLAGPQRLLFVSATPGPYEEAHSEAVVEQIIRPTGLVDPEVEVRPAQGQILDLLATIPPVLERGDRVLVTSLTKKLAEDLTEHLAEAGLKARYLHSDIDTLERAEIIRQLRVGTFDVLVGINLLREGLDIPEVGFIGILDADQEGFLRDTRSLIQTIGRAARNVRARVVLYGDRVTPSMAAALRETQRRRELQMAWNQAHGVEPRTVIRPIPPDPLAELKSVKHLPRRDIPGEIERLRGQMDEAARSLAFELAIELRDQIRRLEARLEEKEV